MSKRRKIISVVAFHFSCTEYFLLLFHSFLHTQDIYVTPLILNSPASHRFSSHSIKTWFFFYSSFKIQSTIFFFIAFLWKRLFFVVQNVNAREKENGNMRINIKKYFRKTRDYFPCYFILYIFIFHPHTQWALAKCSPTPPHNIIFTHKWCCWCCQRMAFQCFTSKGAKNYCE
jgi:hypothetical protein